MNTTAIIASSREKEKSRRNEMLYSVKYHTFDIAEKLQICNRVKRNNIQTAAQCRLSNDLFDSKKLIIYKIQYTNISLH